MNFRRIFGVNIPEVPQRDILIVVNMLRILSTFSRSSRLRVSCILWDSYHRNIVSMGYNGTESGTDNTMELNNVTLDTVIHAEMNALKREEAQPLPQDLDYAAIGSVCNLAARLCGEAEAGERLVPEGADLPIVMAVEGAEGVGKAVHLAEREAVAGPRSKDDAAAGGAKIEGGGVEGVVGGIEDGSGDNLSVGFDGDGDGVSGEAVDEAGGAIQRVDDPSSRGGFFLVFILFSDFFSQKSELRESTLQHFDSFVLSFKICISH